MKRTTRRSSIFLDDKRADSVGNFSTKFSLPSFVRRVDRLTEDQRTAIKRAGFGNLLNIHNQLLSKNLLVELMERWDCGKKAFVFPPGEITITCKDVALILGLRVVGDPVGIVEDDPISDLEKEYGATAGNRKISISAIEDRLESLGNVANEDFIRIFLLFTFGTFLFPNTSGKVESRYLCLLKDLDKVSRFAWGEAVLEDMFRWLSKRKEEHVKYVGGCLILLQVWSYEHIDIGRPNLLGDGLSFPRICRWENSRCTTQRLWFTTKLDELEDDQIIWNLQPTAAEADVDIIKELLNAEVAGKEEISPITEPNAKMKGTLESEHEEDGSTDGAGNVGEAISECSRTSFDVSGGVLYVADTPSPPCYPSERQRERKEPKYRSVDASTENNLNNESCVQFQNRCLDLENIEWKELDELRKENAALRNQISCISKLEEENAKLRREVEDLKRENELKSSSSECLVARLERILLEGNEDSLNENRSSFI